MEVTLKGYSGPEILSDARWRDSPVFIRYGAFRQRTAIVSGEETAVIKDEDTLEDVPDRRVPYFISPPSSRIPTVLTDAIQRRTSGDTVSRAEFPYTVLSALHFANSGGVYLAQRNESSSGACVLKEGRSHVAVDPNTGEDAADRLLNEFNTLRNLTEIPGIVNAHNTFMVNGHRFAELEFVEGVTLYEWVAQNFPFSKTVEVETYTRRCLAIAKKISEIVLHAHAAGCALVDIQPRNIMISEADGHSVSAAAPAVTLIDLELAHFYMGAREGKRRFIGTPGFVSDLDSAFDPRQRDGYSVVRSVIHMFHPVTPLCSLSDTIWEGQKRFIDETFGSRAVDAIQSIDEEFGSPLLKSVAHARRSPVRSAWVGVLSTPERTRNGLVEGILRSRASSREKGVFPGSPVMYESALGAWSVGYGTAGVMLMLDRAAPSTRRNRVFAAELEQLEVQYRACEDFSLLTGRSGLACALSEFGAPEDSVSALVAGSASAAGRFNRYGLADGAGGIAAALASLCLNGGETPLSEAEAMAANLTSGPIVDRALEGPLGLFDGMAGLAVGVLLLSLCPGVDADALRSSGKALIDAAVDALVEAPDGSLQVRFRGALYPYLGSGSAGVGVAVAVMHQLTGEPLTAHHVHVLHRIRQACDVRSCLYPGLLKGMSGLLVAERMFTELLGPPRTAMNPLELLAPFLFHSPSGLLSSGDGGRRLAVDYAHGAAGLLPALANSTHLVDWLPVANPQRLLSPRTRQPITIN
ncbi:protein kinase/lanthionine synthetase C family protein [Tsukamurella sp. PLM1]|uniref:protein kinase/lanthionine synthetase C family protein n=1 Tax=Tsukamurella sp. PLM1 TaxID=2929795 RepID=UPI0020BD842A|nr:protein kinase/lanthionine synthetase C family protein [Tsukamurella sp. PLM1]